MDTIAAISTPPFNGGISVIRISGCSAPEVAAKVFSGKSPLEMRGYTCAYGHISFNGEIYDECVLTVFRAPHSYTGENVVELSCHGGIVVTRRILRLLYSCGARPADAGEFTKRAFLNGKMDLTSAEAVMDIINSKTEAELNASMQLHSGALFAEITRIKQEIMSVLADLEAWADFPEEDLPELETHVLSAKLTALKNGLSELLRGYDTGAMLRNGINCAIVGKPNVGKSTLMNCLSGYSRCIVSDIPGTTRDSITETVVIDNIVLNITDTAGIRATGDEIEQIGVDIARRKLSEAQLILAVFDSSSGLSDEDNELFSVLDPSKTIAVINKIDVRGDYDRSSFSDKFANIVEISAKNAFGIEQLKKEITDICFGSDIAAADCLISNERQRDCCINAEESLKTAISTVEGDVGFDILTVVLEQAASALAELTGESVSEAVIDKIFSKFCIGK